MSFTYEDHLALVKPSDGDTSHGDELRQNFDVIGQVVSPKYSYFVSPDFTTANLANSGATDRRHFDTIQGAIDAIEAKGVSHYANYYTIFLWPGQYDENLTFTDSVYIQGMTVPNPKGQGGGRYPVIRGSSSTASSLLTVTPAAGESVAVGFGNVALTQAYLQATTEGSFISSPYLLDFQDTGTNSTTSYFGLTDCYIDAHTWGDHNMWTSGIKSRGRVNLAFNRTNISAKDYSGGEYTGGIRYLFDIEGLYSDGYYAALYMDSCSIDHLYAGQDGILNIGATFRYDNYVAGRVSRTIIHYPDTVLYYNDTDTGTNSIDGIDKNFLAYGNLNIPGVNF